MSSRFPPVSTDDPSSSSSHPLGSQFDAQVAAHHGPNPSFQYKDATGAPIGPFAVLAYTPDLYPPFMAFGDAILAHASIPPRLQELCILAVTSVYDVPYIAYAHSRKALDAGFSTAQVAQARRGVVPEGLVEEKERVVYELALELARERGPLSDEGWKKAEKVLGREGCARMAHWVGFYLYAGTVMRVGDVKAPEGEE